jgi:hypothetical protein
LPQVYAIVGKTKEKNNTMATDKAIINSFDGSFPQSDRYVSKYFKYLGNIQESGSSIIEAFKTKNISTIESALRNLTDSMKNHIFLIGMGCVIIDREALYADAGYHSYLDYAKHLYEETGLSPQSLSAAKIIIERFMDYNPELRKYGFNLEHNSNKLLYLENALENHADRTEVFKRVANDTFREFQSWARSSDEKETPPPPLPKIKITNGRITVDGKKYESVPEKVKQMIEQDFAELYSIRLSGNEPVIVPVYDEREARSLKKGIDTLLKTMRSKR